jgi:hypothetical protein
VESGGRVCYAGLTLERLSPCSCCKETVYPSIMIEGLKGVRNSLKCKCSSSCLVVNIEVICCHKQQPKVQIPRSVQRYFLGQTVGTGFMDKKVFRLGKNPWGLTSLNQNLQPGDNIYSRSML